MIDLLFIPDDIVLHILRSTIALLVVLNPVGIVPIYIALTQKMESTRRTQLSKSVIITSTVLLFAFAIAGSLIFTVFGITFSSFMVAGGVLLFIVAIELLTGGGWRFVGRINRSSSHAIFYIYSNRNNLSHLKECRAPAQSNRKKRITDSYKSFCNTHCIYCN